MHTLTIKQLVAVVRPHCQPIVYDDYKCKRLIVLQPDKNFFFNHVNQNILLWLFHLDSGLGRIWWMV